MFAKNREVDLDAIEKRLLAASKDPGLFVNYQDLAGNRSSRLREPIQSIPMTLKS